MPSYICGAPLLARELQHEVALADHLLARDRHADRRLAVGRERAGADAGCTFRRARARSRPRPRMAAQCGSPSAPSSPSSKPTLPVRLRVVPACPSRPAGTPSFQLAVWGALQEIPYGDTLAYGELARRLGHANGARAVGLANGANPLPVIVPCHRVIGADGSLTGFGGGLHIKRALLALEGAACVSRSVQRHPGAARRGRRPSQRSGVRWTLISSRQRTLIGRCAACVHFLTRRCEPWSGPIADRIARTAQLPSAVAGPSRCRCFRRGFAAPPWL